jgi:hypothetical protein
MGFISLVFDTTGELLIIHFCVRQILDKKWECNEVVHIYHICQILDKKWEYIEVVLQQFTDCKKACGSVRRMFLYNILIELLSL